MKSTKCPQCGLVYWATDANCKRCGLATEDNSPVAPPAQSEQFQAPYATQPPPPIGAPPDIDVAVMLKNIKNDATFFYIIGGLQILLWFALGNLLIVDGILNISFSFLVHKFRSRVAACFLLALTVLSMIAAIMEMASGAKFGVIAPVVMLLRLYSAFRMVQSTFKLKNYVEQDTFRPLPPPPPSFHPETAPQWTGANAQPQLQPE